jgi:hypothetical protein
LEFVSFALLVLAVAVWKAFAGPFSTTRPRANRAYGKVYVAQSNDGTSCGGELRKLAKERRIIPVAEIS